VGVVRSSLARGAEPASPNPPARRRARDARLPPIRRGSRPAQFERSGAL